MERSIKIFQKMIKNYLKNLITVKIEKLKKTKKVKKVKKVKIN